MKSQFRIVSTLVAGALLVGCGGGVSSGVDGSKAASSLTDAEVQDVCEAIIKYQQDSYSTEALCRAVGVGAYVQGGVAACQTATDACNDATADAEADDPAAVCDAATADLVAGCDATVGDIETCVTEVIDAYASALNDVPACDDIADYEASEGDSSEPSEACQAVAGDAECAIVLSLIVGL